MGEKRELGFLMIAVGFAGALFGLDELGIVSDYTAIAYTLFGLVTLGYGGYIAIEDVKGNN